MDIDVDRTGYTQDARTAQACDEWTRAPHFRRHLEAAYQTAWEIYQGGEPPRGFSVRPRPPLDTVLTPGSQGAPSL